MPTVREIANYAGVSVSTVSLVMNDMPGVSEVMRQRVYQALQMLNEGDETGKRRSNQESSSGERDSLSIVVLHPAILRSSQVFSEFLQGIQAAALQYRMQLRLAVNEPDLPGDHISRLYFSDPSLIPDGVLVIGARQEAPFPDEISQLNIPCVLVGRTSPGARLSAVGPDEDAAAREAARYLIDLGHRAIAFTGGDPVYSYTHSRLRAVQEELRAAGIDALERWVSLGEGDQAARKLLASSPEISAVIFINDAYAIQGLPVFQAAGRRIPEDLSVVSFDDTEQARQFSPALTSVAYPRYLEGFHSVRMIYEQIQNPQILSCQVTFRTNLVIRDSCVPLKAVKD